MKTGIFTLTKNEQRLVVLLVTALVAAAFIRFWRPVNRNEKPNRPDTSASATPFEPVEEEERSDQEQ